MPLKSDILRELESRRGAAVSGQELSERFGVSRNAVWKAVNQLREEGHEILSSTRRGYVLAPESDVLTAEGIRAALPPDRQDMDIIVLNETDSTNNEAKRLIAGGIGGYTLVVSRVQTGGKGRLGRAFYSPEGSIYMSLAFRTDAAISDAVRLTTAASVAVVGAVEELTSSRPLIKWVNDVYLHGKKICGILTEGVTDIESGRVRHIVIGIGLNCGRGEFPPELRDVAANLDREGVSRARLAAGMASRLMDFIDGRADYMEFYRAHSLVLGRRIDYFKNGVKTGAEAIAIDDSGGLIVRHDDGSTACLNTGEISVRVTE